MLTPRRYLKLTPDGGQEPEGAIMLGPDWDPSKGIPSGFSRLYWGHETCQHLIPSLDRILKVARYLATRSMTLTLVFPFVTQEYLEQGLATLAALENESLSPEVVFNDWGLYHEVSIRHREIPLRMGRTLVRGFKDPRFPLIARQVGSIQRDVLSQSGITNPLYRAMIQEATIRGVEVELPLNSFVTEEHSHETFPAPIAVHLPLTLLSITRFCPLHQTRLVRYPPNCHKECLGQAIRLHLSNGWPVTYLFGNAFYAPSAMNGEGRINISATQRIVHHWLPKKLAAFVEKDRTASERYVSVSRLPKARSANLTRPTFDYTVCAEYAELNVALGQRKKPSKHAMEIVKDWLVRTKGKIDRRRFTMTASANTLSCDELKDALEAVALDAPDAVLTVRWHVRKDGDSCQINDALCASAHRAEVFLDPGCITKFSKVDTLIIYVQDLERFLTSATTSRKWLFADTDIELYCRFADLRNNAQEVVDSLQRLPECWSRVADQYGQPILLRGIFRRLTRHVNPALHACRAGAEGVMISEDEKLRPCEESFGSTWTHGSESFFDRDPTSIVPGKLCFRRCESCAEQSCPGPCLPIELADEAVSEGFCHVQKAFCEISRRIAATKAFNYLEAERRLFERFRDYPRKVLPCMGRGNIML